MRHVCMFGHPPALSKPLVCFSVKGNIFTCFYFFAFLLLSSVFFVLNDMSHAFIG